jgi:hypothetical protein
MVRSPSQLIKFDEHASRTVTIGPRVASSKQLDLGIDDLSHPVSSASVVKILRLIRKYGRYHRPIALPVLLWPNEPTTWEAR